MPANLGTAVESVSQMENTKFALTGIHLAYTEVVYFVFYFFKSILIVSSSNIVDVFEHLIKLDNKMQLYYCDNS